MHQTALRQTWSAAGDAQAFETLAPEIRGVLGKRIRELGLRLEGCGK